MAGISKSSLVPAAVGGLAVLALAGWMLNSRLSLKERLPGEDQAGGGGPAAAAQGAGKLTKGPGEPADLRGDWPRFRGANWDNLVTDPTPLAKTWPENGPPRLWSVEVGEGFAAPAIWRGRVYLMDYDRAAQEDALRCLSLADGREIWRYSYPAKIKRDHGMSRTIPSVTENYTVAISPKCQVICVDSKEGALKWRLDLPQEFGTEIPPWYAGQCPYVENDRLILGVGGKALVVAVDCLTGKILWRSANPSRWQMTHSSIAPLSFQGGRQYVYCGSGGLAGVNSEDGKILWTSTDWKIAIANVPTPLVVGEGRFFLSGGYNAGSLMARLAGQGDTLKMETEYRLESKVFGAEQQTPIFYQGHIFGVRPDGQLVCLGLDGKIVRQSGPANRFGKGPFLIAQGMIYALDDNGNLTLAEASISGYRQLARAKVLEGPDAWGPLALAGGRLIVRDLYRMACLDVSAK